METMTELIIAKYNYWMYISLMMIGLYAVVAKNNFVKKIIGMNILQTAIILFYVSISTKQGATIPIIRHAEGYGHEAVNAMEYMNPLPHVLMLTAIVVAVATLGVALALTVRLYSRFGTLEEDEINDQIREAP